MEKKLFFDFGELLFDYTFTKHGTLRRAHELVLPHLGAVQTLDSLEKAHDAAIGEYLTDRKRTDREWTMDKIMGRVLYHLGLPNDPLLRRRMDDTYKINDHDFSPREGIPELLSEYDAKGESLNIISNLPHDSALYELDQYGLRGHFDTITFSHESGWRKPHPAIYELALKKAKIGSSNAYFISHDEGEVEGARRVGIESGLAINVNEIRGLLEQ
jgi:putative hydrolase of the HAD superfamily|tara:strand:- start:276 stop:920 length:645 start_codon:yes stop_codon:yes gene_type:complete